MPTNDATTRLLDDVEARHKRQIDPRNPDGHCCTECWKSWPCDAAKLARILRELVEPGDAVLEDVGHNVYPWKSLDDYRAARQRANEIAEGAQDE